LAKELNFIIKNKNFSFSLTKIERKKIYGWTEIIALDDNQNECKMVSMDESGTVIIPKGGIGLGILNSENLWIDKSELVAVDNDGNAAQLMPSSFSVTNDLLETVTIEEFLDHSITAVYEIEGAENDMFLSEIAGNIFTFNFNFRDGYESSPAFLMESEGKAFILVGVKNDFPFIGLEEAGYLDEGEDDDDSEDGGIDFSMI